MKNWLKMIISFIVLVLLVLGGLALWQRENLQVLYEAMQYNAEDIGSQIQVTKDEVASALEKYNLSSIRRLTPEEEDQVKKGELSWEEAIEKIILPQAIKEGEIPTVSQQEALEVSDMQDKVETMTPIQELAPATSNPVLQATSKKESELVGAATVQMYGLQAKYLGLLGGLEARGMQALRAIPSKQRTMQKLMNVGMPFVQEALALEKQCDAEVDKVLQQLQKELKAIKADDAIVETMRGAYYTEKRLKKAYYLSLIPK